MGDVISALTQKRAELVGLIGRLEQEAAQQRANLVHIDGVIRLFSPATASVAAGSGASEQRQRRFRPGELARSILDALRRAGGPVTGGEIAATILAAKGAPTDDPAWVDSVQKLVHRGLVYHERRRTVVRAGRDGRAIRWALAV
jgi:hypothetical protein